MNKQHLEEIAEVFVKNIIMVNPIYLICFFQVIEMGTLTKNRVKTLHKKWSFPLRNSSVNEAKSTGNFELGHIYWINL